MWIALAAASAVSLSPAQELSNYLASNPSYRAGMVCSPLGAVADLAQEYPAISQMLDAGITDPDVRAYADNWLDRSSQHSLGLDPGGSFGLLLEGAAANAGMTLYLPFGGSPAQAKSILQYLAGKEGVEADGDGWKFGSEHPATAKVEGDFLRVIFNGNGLSTPSPNNLAALLTDIPYQTGCAFVMDDSFDRTKRTEAQAVGDAPAEKGKTPVQAVTGGAETSALPATESKPATTSASTLESKPDANAGSTTVAVAGDDSSKKNTRLEPEAFAFFLPMSLQSPVSVRMKVKDDLKVRLDKPSGRPTIGNSLTKPNFVLSVQAPLLETLTAFKATERRPEDDQLLNAVKKKVRIDGGTMVAVFTNDISLDHPDFSKVDVVVSMPIRQASGLPVTGAGVRRNLEKVARDPGLKSKAEKLSRRRLKLSLGDTSKSVLYTESRWNQLWIATSEARLDEALGKAGAPWVDDTYTRQLLNWPLMIDALIPVPGGVQLGLWAGFKMSDRTMRLDTAFHGSPEIMHAVLGSLLQNYAVPAVRNQVSKSRRKELSTSIAQIVAAEERYFASNGKYLPTRAAPRPMDEASSEQALWVPGDEWAPLDLQLGPVYGIYWVEVSEDGAAFTVHAVADLDDDRNISHMVQSKGSTVPELLTPDNIY